MYQRVITDPGGNSLVRLIADGIVVNGSILAVPADSVAFVVINGHISNPYSPGRHTINTGVDPFFVRFRNIMTNGNPGVTCQIFYVNTVKENCSQGGTGNMIFQDSRYRLSMTAKAAYTIRYTISNPRAFLRQLVGMHNNSFDQEDVQPAIDSMILPVIKEAVIASLSNSTVHTVQSNLTGIATDSRGRLENDLVHYGISLKAIAVTSINISEEDMKRLREIEETEARGRVATSNEVDNIERVWGGDVNIRTMAEVLTGSVRGPATPNAGRGEMAQIGGAMAMMPMQAALMGQYMNQINNQMSNIMNGPPPVPTRAVTCPGCGRTIDSSDAFCKYCGHRM